MIKWLSLMLVGLPAAFASAGNTDRIPFSTPLKQVGYKLISYDHNVAVYRHPGHTYVMLAAEAHFPVRPEKVMNVLLNYEAHVGRMPRVVKSKVIRRFKNRMIAYRQIHGTLVSDRDTVIDVRWGKTGHVHWIDYRNVAGVGPVPPSGVVRMRTNIGHWQVKATTTGSFVRWQGYVDMGGSLPRWLVKRFAGGGMTKTFDTICSMVGRTRGCPR